MNPLSPVDQSSAPYGVFVLRASLGIMWIAHALMKYVLFTIPGFAGFLAKVGFPAELAWPVFLAELIGGVLILMTLPAIVFGLFTRWFHGNASTVHIGNGWIFSNAGGGWEYPAFLIAASFALWLLGDGAFALRSRPLWFVGTPRAALA